MKLFERCVTRPTPTFDGVTPVPGLELWPVIRLGPDSHLVGSSQRFWIVIKICAPGQTVRSHDIDHGIPIPTVFDDHEVYYPLAEVAAVPPSGVYELFGTEELWRTAKVRVSIDGRVPDRLFVQVEFRGTRYERYLPREETELITIS